MPQSIKLAICLIALILTAGPACANKLVSGFCVNSQRSRPDRQTVLKQLKAVGVTVIRTSFPGPNPGDFNIDFAKSAYDKGIKILLIVSPQNPPDTGSALSAADPELSRRYFQSLLNRLDGVGVSLQGLELGNEINWCQYNGDFPPAGKGQGRTFGFDALKRDPEGKQIAAGFLQYIKILSVLKDVRDHSMANKNTPIISAGLTDFDVHWPTLKQKMDAVNLEATVRFLRANGLDKYVDGYGLHRYPKDSMPQARKARLENACKTFSLPHGGKAKPVWVTEWGVENPDKNCPSDESTREPLVKETMDNLRSLAARGKVAAAIYYRWDSYPVKRFDPSSVFRCGALTDPGKQILIK